MNFNTPRHIAVRSSDINLDYDINKPFYKLYSLNRLNHEIIKLLVAFVRIRTIPAPLGLVAPI